MIQMKSGNTTEKRGIKSNIPEISEIERKR
jgi:hypothetical protein